MTNEEISKWLMNLKDDIGKTQYQPLWHYAEALDMAIEALQQPEQCEDTISRPAAIEALQEHRNLFCDNTPETFSKLSYAEKSRVDELDMAIATLINLPSAQPNVPDMNVGEMQEGEDDAKNAKQG